MHIIVYFSQIFVLHYLGRKDTCMSHVLHVWARTSQKVLRIVMCKPFGLRGYIIYLGLHISHFLVFLPDGGALGSRFCHRWILLVTTATMTGHSIGQICDGSFFPTFIAIMEEMYPVNNKLFRDHQSH